MIEMMRKNFIKLTLTFYQEEGRAWTGAVFEKK